MKWHVLTVVLVALLALSCAEALPLDGYIDVLYAGDAVQEVDGGLWVPWYDTSSSCTVNDLHSGTSCNAPVSMDANCMVSDEFSQLGILLALAENETRFQEFDTTVGRIQARGALPSWRSYRDGTLIEQCRDTINGNCDTASDADARIIIAYLRAETNPAFSGDYLAKGLQAADDFITYDLVNECRSSSLGYGDICWWMAAGYGAKQGGLGSSDFGYTGYYADGVQAMLMACGASGDMRYCAIAGNLTLNYLEAAKYDGVNLSFPPGRSFRWDNLAGVPVATCTNTCSPIVWDGADAPRALGMCQAYGFSVENALPLPDVLGTYCADWAAQYLADPEVAFIQYTPTGSYGVAQHGYFAQGLQALFYQWWDPIASEASLSSALSHFDGVTWDGQACFGIYTTAFSLRSLGESLYRSETSVTLMEQNLAPPPMFGPLMLLQGGGYAPEYGKDDIGPILEDGVGTAMASFVEHTELLVLGMMLMFVYFVVVRKW